MARTGHGKEVAQAAPHSLEVFHGGRWPPTQYPHSHESKDDGALKRTLRDCPEPKGVGRVALPRDRSRGAGRVKGKIPSEAHPRPANGQAGACPYQEGRNGALKRALCRLLPKRPRCLSIPGGGRKQAAFERAGNHVFAGLAAALALLVYLLTLARTVTGEDSGELIVAAWSLGIPHPPGYPLWCLSAHPFTWIPLGAVAWRAAFFSAVCAAGTVYVVVLLVRALGCGITAAFTAGLALAFSREFWEQAVIAEVYTLNALCVAASLLLLFTWYRTRADRHLYALAVLYGLSLGNHGTFVLLGPVFALFVFVADRPWRWGLYARLTALAAVACFLVYLYLPLRSMANPAIDWGNPETLSNWWDVVRRKQYAFMFSEHPRSWMRFAEELRIYALLWTREFTPWVGALGLAGLLLLVYRRHWHGLLMVSVAGIVVAGFSYIQNFDDSVEWVWVMTVFAIPAYLVTAVGIGAALDRVGRTGYAPVLLLAAICVASPLVTHWRHNDRSHSRTAEDYARNMLAPLAPDALVITETDTAAFAGLYMQAVLGLRPDITLGRINGYLAPAVLANAPGALREAVGPFPRRRDEPRIFAWLLEHTARPVYFERRPRLPEGAPKIGWKRAGLLWRALREGETDPIDYRADWTWHSLEDDVARGDYTARAIYFSLHLGEAEEALRRGEDVWADALVRGALAAYGRDVRSLNNAGTLYARHGEREKAKALFLEALAQAPSDATARKNLDRLSP